MLACVAEWKHLFGTVDCRRTRNGTYARCHACGSETGRVTYFDAIAWAHGHVPRCPQAGLWD